MQEAEPVLELVLLVGPSEEKESIKFYTLPIVKIISVVVSLSHLLAEF